MTADHYIAALPVEQLVLLVSPEMRRAEPRLAGLDRLVTRWMNGIMFYLDRDVPLVHGHAIYIDSEWALTSISQAQFWDGIDLEDYGDGRVEGILSVDVSEWERPSARTGKVASKCSAEEIRAEVWAQLKDHLDDGTLRDDNVVAWFLDPAIRFPNPTGATNLEPLLVNTAGSWQRPPGRDDAHLEPLPRLGLRPHAHRPRDDGGRQRGRPPRGQRDPRARDELDRPSRARCGRCRSRRSSRPARARGPAALEGVSRRNGEAASRCGFAQSGEVEPTGARSRGCLVDWLPRLRGRLVPRRRLAAPATRGQPSTPLARRPPSADDARNASNPRLGMPLPAARRARGRTGARGRTRRRRAARRRRPRPPQRRLRQRPPVRPRRRRRPARRLRRRPPRRRRRRRPHERRQRQRPPRRAAAATTCSTAATATTSCAAASGHDYVVEDGFGDDKLLSGGPGDDYLDGNRGSDRLVTGGAGDDILRGGPGRDTLDGGDGDDRLAGGDSEDELIGGAGDDIVVSGVKYDEVDLGPGDDHLYRTGFDNVDCGPGIDTIHASRAAWDPAAQTPIPIERYMGPRRGRIRNCELIVADDGSDDFMNRGQDITASWTNRGRSDRRPARARPAGRWPPPTRRATR